MANDDFWDVWGGWIKAGGTIAAVAVTGIASAPLLTSDDPSSPAEYDSRVRQIGSDLSDLKRLAQSTSDHVQDNREDIARLQAEMKDLQKLGDERKERFLTLEVEQRRLADVQHAILDRVREIEIQIADLKRARR